MRLSPQDIDRLLNEEEDEHLGVLPAPKDIGEIVSRPKARHQSLTRAKADLAARAANFHQPRSARNFERLQRLDPDAWALYSEWSNSQDNPDGFGPKTAEKSIRALLESR